MEANITMNLVLDYLENVNFAIVQSRTKVCRWCVVENRTAQHIDQFRLKIQGDYIETFVTDDYYVGAQSMVRVDGINLQMKGKEIARLTESVLSSIKVTVTCGDSAVHEQSFPISFMAYDQWNGIEEFPQILSSFVTPNHPCIASILNKASGCLYDSAGVRTFDNYLSEDTRIVKAQVKAVYDALYKECLTYIFSRPSYEEKGQRIRLADKVMTDRMGNCLDLTLLFAACFEYIDLNSLIIITPGHAFIGVWLTPECCLKSVDDDVMFLMNNTRRGEERLLLFECTNVTSTEYADFDSAVAASYNNFIGVNSEVCYIDLYRCRREGYRPLPQLVNEEGMWRLSDEKASVDERGKGFTSIDQNRHDEEEASQHKVTKLQMWERKLLDFTLRNTLLNVKMDSAIQLISVDAGQLCEDLLRRGKRYTIAERPADVEGIDSAGSNAVFDSLHLPLEVYGAVRNDMKSGCLHCYHTASNSIEIMKKIRRNARLMMEENGASSLYLAIGLLQWMEEGNESDARIAPILLLPVELVYRNSEFQIKWNGEELMLNVTLIEYLRQTSEMDFPYLDETMNDENGVDAQKVFGIIRKSVSNKANWAVAEEAILGIFSFSKFVMWNDIHQNGKEICDNTIIRSLVSGDAIPADGNESAESTHLDDATQPGDLCLPLPYDSSQLLAVQEAMEGRSFILHGPPGTGKSQTITNMITSALYKGKRVLFVAEKMAALSVVQNRLEKLGLGDFCLELHSNKSTKQHLLHQLERVSTAASVRTDSGRHEDAAGKLLAQRNELIRYINGLHHRKTSDDFSLYECIMHYCRYKDGCSRPLDWSEGELPDITPNTLDEYEYYIDRLSVILRLIGSPCDHPLRGLRPNASTTTHLADLSHQLNRCIHSAAHLDSLAILSARMLKRDAPTTLAQLDAYIEELKEYAQLREQILAHTNPRIVNLDAYEWKMKWERALASNPLMRLIRREVLYKNLKNRYRATLKRAEVGMLIESLYQLQSNETYRLIARSAEQDNLRLDDILNLYDEWRARMNDLTYADVENLEDLNITAVERVLCRWRDNLEQMKDWKQWCLVKDDLVEKKMVEIGLRLEHSAIRLDELKNAYFMRYFKQKAMEIISRDEVLDMFNGLLFDEKVDRYRRLADEFQRLSNEALLSVLKERVKKVNASDALAGQMTILNRNISNRGRGTSIRRLFDQIPDVIGKSCPCMLMSPMSVAQYIDVHSNKFDLVIFDEASQIPTCEAVGAIARGRNVVIVGDTQQMPPTTFFTNTRAMESEYEMDDLESILEDCHALKLPSLLLSWHYRSKHESLIAFSNTEFYGSKLNTFPAVDDQERRAIYVPVKGVYHKGGSRSNRNEALAIVNEIERRLSDEMLRRRSIGVISFNVQQQYLIEDMLEERMDKNRQLRQWAEASGESIFVKNLENVQGDERDVILFSIGYGPDKQGRVSMNFGPLNLVGGERRLNVAVTRSRYEMMVFSSLRASDIDLRRSNALGVLELKRFLQYVEEGVLVQPAMRSADVRTDRVITEQMAALLREQGQTVKTFVGKSRFKVNLAIEDSRHNGQYLLGIILDDKTYRDTPTMCDREIIQPKVLLSLGWNLIHVWTVDWFERPQHVIDNILSEVSRLTAQFTDEPISTIENE